MGQIIDGEARPVAKPKPKGKPDARLVAFAAAVLSGKSYRQAGLQAGYTASYVERASGIIAERAMRYELIPDPQTLQANVTQYYDAIAQIQADMQAALPEIAEAVISLAKAGEPKAWKEVFDRTMGPIAQRHQVDIFQVDALIEGMLRDAEDLIDDPEVLARLGQRWKARLQALPAPN